MKPRIVVIGRAYFLQVKISKMLVEHCVPEVFQQLNNSSIVRLMNLFFVQRSYEGHCQIAHQKKQYIRIYHFFNTIVIFLEEKLRKL